MSLLSAPAYSLSPSHWRPARREPKRPAAPMRQDRSLSLPKAILADRTLQRAAPAPRPVDLEELRSAQPRPRAQPARRLWAIPQRQALARRPRSAMILMR